MTAKLACAVMTLAEACLGDHRRDWALAMRAEFELAIDDGRPLGFAFGCLTGALRDMPKHEEGRFALISHAIALALFPIAALLILGAASGFPFLPSGHAGLSGWLAGRGEPLALLTPWNRNFAPALALLIWALIAGHLLMPWFILERDWTRVATLARVNAAATVTLLLFTGVLFLDMAFMALPVLGLAIELSAISLLYQWQARLFEGAPPGALGA
ncbi:MAG: hypothetical protein JF608_06720 [Sphingomonadales bacterium]|jgi:hypothetical protein|nr:hypothetical protein [Sphingomonadales bacterium]